MLGSKQPREETFKFDISDELLAQVKNRANLSTDSVNISIIPKGGAGGSVTLEELNVFVEE